MNHALVFLGPSLPADEARRLLDCEIRPPARQGDVFRALAARPRLIVLIDGVFEHSPSVWHHEIVAANAAGVAMIGASSMGALRAAELAGTGMIEGVGDVFGAYAAGELVDDGEVALLHASAEHAFRPLTVPLVNVRAAAAGAIRAKVLTRAEGEELVRAAGEVFYQSRSWSSLLLRLSWKPATRDRWLKFAKAGLPDVKADDARLALKTARRRMKAKQERAVRRRNFPSHVRRRRVHEDESLGTKSGDIATAASERPDARSWVEEGVRRKLVGFWAREMGLKISNEELGETARGWFDQFGEEDIDAFLAASGLDESQALTFFEELALDQKAVRSSLWMVTDAPAVDEAIAFEARRRGIWAELARMLAHQKRTPAR